MELDDVATTSTDHATKVTASLSTEVTQNYDVQYLADLVKQLLSGERSTDDIEQNRSVSKTSASVRCEKRKLCPSFKTASLWIQYMYIIIIIIIISLLII